MVKILLYRTHVILKKLVGEDKGKAGETAFNLMALPLRRLLFLRVASLSKDSATGFGD